MLETPNAGFAGVLVMDEVSPQATQLVLTHLLGCGCLDIPMTPIDTSSWFPQEADIDSVVRLLSRD
jgi:hypothetical protein